MRTARHALGALTILVTLTASTLPATAAGGDLLWQHRIDGFGGVDRIVDSAANPPGDAIYLTGTSSGPNGNDILTIAYDASSGQQLWSSRIDGPLHGNDSGQAITVSPNGARVYVVGSLNPASDVTRLLVALDAVTGAELWRRQKDGSTFSDVAAIADRVLATASEDPDGTGPELYRAVVISFNAASGTKQWQRTLTPYRYILAGIAASPDGSRVFAAGLDNGCTSPSTCQFPQDNEFFTVAYSATGTKLWTRRTESETGQFDLVSSVVVAPDGGRVFVAGEMGGTVAGVDHQVGEPTSGASAVTVAYGSGGRELWISQINGLGIPWPFRVVSDPVVSPVGDRVFVSVGVVGEEPVPICPGGLDDDFGVVAWDSATGAPDWYTTYDSSAAPTPAEPCPAQRDDYPADLAVAPDASRVFVTGVGFACRDLECFTLTGVAIETVGLAVGTGDQKWARRIRPATESDAWNAGDTISVSSDSAEVVVGAEASPTSSHANLDWVALGYDTA